MVQMQYILEHQILVLEQKLLILIMKNYMKLYSLEELTGNNGEKVIYVEVISKRFNTKEFKKQFESLYNSYLKTTKNYRFKFTY